MKKSFGVAPMAGKFPSVSSLIAVHVDKHNVHISQKGTEGGHRSIDETRGGWCPVSVTLRFEALVLPSFGNMLPCL